MGSRQALEKQQDRYVPGRPRLQCDGARTVISSTCFIGCKLTVTGKQTGAERTDRKAGGAFWSKGDGPVG